TLIASDFAERQTVSNQLLQQGRIDERDRIMHAAPLALGLLERRNELIGLLTHAKFELTFVNGESQGASEIGRDALSILIDAEQLGIRADRIAHAREERLGSLQWCNGAIAHDERLKCDERRQCGNE